MPENLNTYIKIIIVTIVVVGVVVILAALFLSYLKDRLSTMNNLIKEAPVSK